MSSIDELIYCIPEDRLPEDFHEKYSNELALDIAGDYICELQDELKKLEPVKEVKGDLKSELKALLKRHNASIEFDCGEGSDTYGIYDERIVVTVRPDPKRFEEKEIFSVNGVAMSYKDIE
jgi:hypothetical protein